ncbi:MAG: alpha-ketoacid dehydrogenase subunit beta [Kordiimonadales bacterium]|nr:MAG: alpha-ketoacid dehydrogenase subunit beta [Kordiimonadales bacterium]
MTIREALNKAHHQVMAADNSVIVIGEDIVGGTGFAGEERGGVFGVTAGLATKFGTGRVIDTPISETAFVGMAVGAAMTGLKPIVEVMFCDFMGVCFDQLMNQAAKARFLSGDRVLMPLVIRTTMGAGDSSGAVHSQSLHAMLASIPGLTVVCPSTPADAAGLLKSALKHPDPVLMFEHKGLYDYTGDVADSLPAVPIGQGRLVLEGSDVTVVAVSAMLHRCETVALGLASKGISVELIDPRTIRPIDSKLILSSLSKTGRLVVIDEGPEFGGFADSVIALAASEGFAYLKAAPVKITPPQTPTPYGRALEKAWLPDENKIATTLTEMMTVA